MSSKAERLRTELEENDARFDAEHVLQQAEAIDRRDEALALLAIRNPAIRLSLEQRSTQQESS